MTEEEFMLVNDLALAQISKLERTDNATSPAIPLAKTASTFWGTDDYASRYKTSTTAPSTIPRNYYLSRGAVPGNIGGGNPIYTPVLLATYRAATSGDKPTASTYVIHNEDDGTEEEDSMSCLGSDLFGAKEKAPGRVTGNIFNEGDVVKVPSISQSAGNQVIAIIFSSIVKIATSIVVSWARDRKVPLEVL